jgi:hypothetical protein
MKPAEPKIYNISPKSHDTCSVGNVLQNDNPPFGESINMALSSLSVDKRKSFTYTIQKGLKTTFRQALTKAQYVQAHHCRKHPGVS